MDEQPSFQPVGEWAERASCRGLTHLFFPNRHDQHAFRRAQSICKQCPVRPECFDHALHNFEAFGIRAGMGPRKISKERIKRGIANNPNKPRAHGTKKQYKNGCRCEQCTLAHNNGSKPQ